MASEGLDIPLLKSQYYMQHRNLFLIRLILGRISRQPLEQSGNAILIANKDEVKGEVSRLYNSDEIGLNLYHN